MKVSKTRMICEAAIFIAMAEILSLIKLYEFPNGGSITLEMLPIILFAARYGCGWGSLAGLVYGTITYLIGNKFSIDWTTIICDYFIAFVALGFGAGLLSRRKWSVYYGTVIGGVLRFLAHFLIGVFVWGKWMPDTFLGKPTTSPWIYSLIYNGSYMLPSIVLCLVVFALLYKSLRKYFTSADLLAARRCPLPFPSRAGVCRPWKIFSRSTKKVLTNAVKRV